tara:strand:- start:41 stop:1693 length:1653 start_codon:yes stop_codon:yes gene_type:complete
MNTSVTIKNICNIPVTITSIYSNLLMGELSCDCQGLPVTIAPQEEIYCSAVTTIDFGTLNCTMEVEEHIIVLLDGQTPEIDNQNEIRNILVIDPDFIPPLISSCTEFETVGPVYEPYSSAEQPITDLGLTAYSLFGGILDNGKRFSSASKNILMWNEDGTKDLTFGTNGIYDNSTSTDFISHITTDGVYLYILGIEDGTLNNFVERILPNGTVDLSYGTAGRFIFTLTVLPGIPANSSNYPTKAIHLDDGSMLVMTLNAVTTALPTYVYKIRSDGTLDPLFGTGGYIVLTNLPNDDINTRDMEYHKPTGNIYILALDFDGVTTAIVEVHRFLSDGSIDLTYGVSGEFNFDPSNAPVNLCGGTDQRLGTSFTLGPDESIYVNIIGLEPTSITGCGAATNAPNARFLSVLKLTPNGVIDPTWGTNGVYKDIVSRPVASEATVFQFAPVTGFFSQEDNSISIPTWNGLLGSVTFNMLQLDENGVLIGGDQDNVLFVTATDGQPPRTNNVIPIGNGRMLFVRSENYNLGFQDGNFDVGEFCYPKITYGERNRPW